MAINFEHERVLTLAEAARAVPRRHGRTVHLGTLYRWHSRGLRGTRLEAIRIGGTLCTSMEALQRFFERLSTGAASAAAEPSRASTVADKELELRGL